MNSPTRSSSLVYLGSLLSVTIILLLVALGPIASERARAEGADGALYPIPISVQDYRLASINVPGTCRSWVLKIVEELQVHLVSYASATALFFVTDARATDLALTYPNLAELRHAIAASSQGVRCKEPDAGVKYLWDKAWPWHPSSWQGNAYLGVRVYLYAKGDAGQVYRLFTSDNLCGVLDCASTPAPGELTVKFVKEATKSQINEFIFNFGLKYHETIQPFPPGSGPDLYVFDIPAPQVKAWVKIFQHEPLVAGLFKQQHRTAAVDALAFFTAAELAEKAPPAPSAHAWMNIAAADLRAKLIEFLYARFGDRQVNNIRSTPLYLAAEIAPLRGEIIAHEPYWEQLQVWFICSSVASDGRPRELSVIAEGKYATGLGSQPPADNNYKPMEPNYRDSLQRYVQGLANAAATFLDKGRKNDKNPH